MIFSSRSLLLAAGLALIFLASTWAGDHYNSWLLRISGALCGLALTGLLLRGYLSRPVVRKPTRSALLRLGLFWSAVLLLMLVLATLYVTYNRAQAFIHPGRTVATVTPLSVGINNYQNVSFQTEDGLTLRGWYIPTRNGAVIVYSAGFGGNRSNLLTQAARMAREGYGALLFDMRNTGESDGALSTMGYYEARDIVAAVQFVQVQPGVDPNRIALQGQSMGGSAVLQALPHLPPIRGVVLECTFTTIRENIAASVQNLGLPEFPFGTLVAYFGQRASGVDLSAVRPIDSLAAYYGPVLIIHGERDDLLPVRNAFDLYEAANQPKELYILPDAGHCDFSHAEPEGYFQRLVDFYQQALE